jgi:hypothetical protein
MQNFSFRIPRAFNVTWVAFRDTQGVSLQWAIQEALAYAENNQAGLSRYFQTSTRRKRSKRGNSKIVLTTTIDRKTSERLDELAGQSKNPRSLCACNAFIFFIENFETEEFKRENENLKNLELDVRREMSFHLQNLTIEKHAKGRWFKEKPLGKTVVFDALIFLYAFAREGSGKDGEYREDCEIGTSQQCLNLVRSVREGEIRGYTTTRELSRLADILRGLKSARLKKAQYNQRIRSFIASILRANFLILDEGIGTLFHALTKTGSLGDASFLGAIAQLPRENLVIACVTQSSLILKSGYEVMIPEDLYKTPGKSTKLISI